MRDLGGLLAMLILASIFLNSMFTYNKLENALVSQLYKLPKMVGIEDKQSKTLNPA